jgi:LEA14-like dessication related protein
MKGKGRAWRWGTAASMLACCGIIQGCALAFKQPRVSVGEVRLASLALTGGTVMVQLDVSNPNRYALESQSLRYTLAFASGDGEEKGWTTLAEGELADTVRVPAHGATRVEAVVPFDLAAVGAALARLLRQGELEYRFSGELLAGTPLGRRGIPFDERGRIRP